ncbi:MAG: hypothetical protein HRU19_07815 [Pseudobacteriovorax sp.]|nr:hypothetical protein [Pseudobacteriovorax sp.]
MTVSIAVTAKSFLKNSDLVDRLIKTFPNSKISLATESDYGLPQVKEFLMGHDVWLIGREAAKKDLLAQLPDLKLVTKYGVGLDNVDVAACDNLGINVYYEPGINSQEVAELTLAFMISLARNIGLVSRLLSQGQWLKNGGHNFSGSTVGVVGFGHIGSKVARLAKAFGCHILVNDVRDVSKDCEAKGFEFTDYYSLLERSDFVTFHVPFTDKTQRMLSGEALNRLKPDVKIINTSRGGVICQKSLTEMLANERIGGLACDVFEVEPLSDKNLYLQGKFIGTAHIGGNSVEAVQKMGISAIAGIEKYLANR